MLIDNRIWAIGDPHFGKNFPNTPLHRRGEREALQRAQFKEELNTPNVERVVMIGDLFDKPIVPLSVLSQVVHDVVEAAQANPHVEYVFMAGNHDISRQLTEQGAWEIFSLAVGWLDNVIIVNGMDFSADSVFFAWDWGGTAAEQVERFFEGDFSDIRVVFGHWDLRDFGGDSSHVCPTKLLKEKFPNAEIYSGHYHTEGDYEVDGVTVHCTGSMQPYAHGEGDMYVTLTLEEALAQAEDLKDKCVRVVLQPGEVMPDLDCLQLSAMRAEQTEEIEIEVSSVFDMDTIMKEALQPLPEQVQTFIKERLGASD